MQTRPLANSTLMLLYANSTPMQTPLQCGLYPDADLPMLIPLQCSLHSNADATPMQTLPYANSTPM